MAPATAPKPLPTFEVDKAGLAKLLARKGKEFAVIELVQNAWDEDTREVHVTLEPRDDDTYKLVVEDDNPEGFKDLRHAYTLFAESAKKDDPTKRGRFNMGEKLVIALCREAAIVTTKGSILFSPDGRRMSTKGRKRGSVFTGIVPLTADEAASIERAVFALIPPPGISTTFNMREVPTRESVLSFVEPLKTEKADAEGNLRPTTRRTTIELFEPLEGECAMLYELGIPVVATDDRWHVNVQQKVPLNTDRDNVPPAFLRDVRALVLNHAHEMLRPEDTRAAWVTEALEDERVEPEAVGAVVTGRYGDRAVISDPTDPEANRIAAAEGYTVIPGGALSREAWANVRGAGIVKPAGQVTPSPNANEGKDSAKRMDEDHWPEGVRNVVEFAKAFAVRLMGVESIDVYVVNDNRWITNGNVIAAAYGPRSGGTRGELTFNFGRLGFKWFENGPTEPVIDLIIHEFGHHFCSNHLDTGFYRALTKLGARATRLALDEPEFYRAFIPAPALSVAASS